MRDDRPPTLTTNELAAGLRDLSGSAAPQYHDDILARVARTRQRPAWTFIERWIPMPIALRLAVVPRALVILLLLLGLTLAMTAALLTVGGRPPLPAAVALPPPAGLAGNGLIAYDSAGDIWIAEPYGSDPRPLTSGPALESLPVWSRDGTRLAYWAQEAKGAPTSLVVVQPDGSEAVTVATDPGGQMPLRTEWSPDGTRLAYSMCPDFFIASCTERVFVAAADGSGSTQVGDPTLVASKPDWSPDGASIAFQGTPPQGRPGVYVMAADGRAVRRLSSLPDGDDYNAYMVDWAPDGSGIVTQGGLPTAVWLVSADGGTATQLATGGIAWWSPDGTWLAYLKDMSRLALVSADGAETRDFPIFGPSGFAWSPDATRLVVLTGRGTSLAVIDAATGDRLAEIPGLDQSHPAEVHYPSWQRVAP